MMTNAGTEQWSATLKTVSREPQAMNSPAFAAIISYAEAYVPYGHHFPPTSQTVEVFARTSASPTQWPKTVHLLPTAAYAALAKSQRFVNVRVAWGRQTTTMGPLCARPTVVLPASALTGKSTNQCAKSCKRASHFYVPPLFSKRSWFACVPLPTHLLSRPSSEKQA